MNTKLLDTIHDALVSSPTMQSASPWRLVTETAVGGAVAAGFDRATDELLVVTSTGQGIFDTTTGQRTYRNRENSGYDHENLEATRLDKKAEQPIPMAGDDGGGLRRSTSDGWTVDVMQMKWPTSYGILQSPGASIYFLDPKWKKYEKDATFQVVKKLEGLPVAFGFSWSGQTLVWLDRSDLVIWARET